MMKTINEKRTRELLKSLYEEKWLSLPECVVLTGLSQRTLRTRCKKRLIEHQDYGGRLGIKVQWRNLKAYMDSHAVPTGSE